jgi:signal transduction histidine kinase
VQVEVRAVETFADLLFAVDSDAAQGSFYNRLCEAACTLADLERSAVFLYDSARRRVRVVGSHGIGIDEFRDVHIGVDSAPMALRALSEDKVLEATDDFAALLPPEYERFLGETRLICTPVSAAGHWPGVILSTRPVDRPLAESERHMLWSLGKIAALAASARVSTREQERARQLQDRIDLAREIHDGVVQRLFGVSLALAGEGELSASARRRAADEIQEALSDLRRAVQRPLGRTSRETHSTLVAEVADVRDEHPELDVRLDAAPGAAVPAHLEPLAQSVFDEALRNALKHADPSEVVVRVERNGAFVLEVVNDGVAASAPVVAQHAAGMGLRLAAVEALQYGGVIEFGRIDEPGRWRVRLIVPVEDGA